MTNEEKRTLLEKYEEFKAKKHNRGIDEFEDEFIRMDIDDFISVQPEDKGRIVENKYPERVRGCRTCKFIDCDMKHPCVTCGDGIYQNYEPIEL